MKWTNETRNENGTPSAQELLPTIEDSALLEAVSGGAESVHLYLKASPGWSITNGGVTHEDFTNGGVTHTDTWDSQR